MESDFFDSEIVKSWLWLRYIVDIFFIWTEGQDKLEEFRNRLNNLHPNLKFAHEKSNSSVNFLDVNVSIGDKKVETDLFCKPTDCHQLLHFNSAHPFHNKKSLFKARDCISKDCSSPATFQRKLQSLKTWFCKRGYPHKIVDSQIKRVSEKSLDELFEGLDEKETGVPLVVTNHSRFHNLSAILRKIF